MCEIKLLKGQMDCRLCGIVIAIISVFCVAVAMNISVSELNCCKRFHQFYTDLVEVKLRKK